MLGNNQLLITLTGPVTITAITGTKYIIRREELIRTRNANSIALYGERPWLINSLLIQSKQDAIDHTRALAQVHGFPQYQLNVSYIVTPTTLPVALAGEVSKLLYLQIHRLALAGTDNLHFIEQERHHVTAGHWQVFYRLFDSTRLVPWLRSGSTWGKDSRVYF